MGYDKGLHEFEIGKDKTKYIAEPGILFIAQNEFHKVTVISEERSIRFAISLEEKAIYE